MILLVDGLVALIPQPGSVIVATLTTFAGSEMSKIPTSPFFASSRGQARNLPSAVSEISCVCKPEKNDPSMVGVWESRFETSQISTCPPQPDMKSRLFAKVTSWTDNVSLPCRVSWRNGVAGLLTFQI